MSNPTMSGEIVLEVYKQMLELQSSNHNTSVALLLGMTVLLLGITIYWNKHGAKQFIQNEIKEKLKEQTDAIYDELQKKIRVDISEQVLSYDRKIIRVEAEVYRSMALHSSSNKSYANAISWWGSALECAIKLEEHARIRKIMGSLKRNIDKATVGNDTNIQIIGKEEVLRIISQIPVILDEEKKYMIKKIQDHFVEKNSEQ